MKLKVMALNGSSFVIDVNPGDLITVVKKNIEATQDGNAYPADLQMLVYQGKDLEDDTTLQDNQVAENSFVQVMLKKGLPSMNSYAADGTGTLDCLRKSTEFQELEAKLQAKPQILQQMLQHLEKQSPQVERLIQEHRTEFLRSIIEPNGGESNNLGQLTAAIPHDLKLTPEESEAIGRLEAIGFERALVVDCFFACNKKEHDAAFYLKFLRSKMRDIKDQSME